MWTLKRRKGKKKEAGNGPIFYKKWSIDDTSVVAIHPQPIEGNLFLHTVVNLIKHFTIIIHNCIVIWFEICPYYESRVVIYALKMFIRLATNDVSAWVVFTLDYEILLCHALGRELMSDLGLFVRRKQNIYIAFFMISFDWFDATTICLLNLSLNCQKQKIQN